MEVFLIKGPGGAMMPADDEQAALLQSIKTGSMVRCQVARIRNPKFHRKYFALLGYAYGLWQETQPPRTWRGQPVKTNFDRFREEVQILAGFGEPVWNLNGEMRLQSKSISFANMSEADFEALYSNVIDVLLGKVLHRDDLTPEKMREYVDRVLQFS